MLLFGLKPTLSLLPLRLRYRCVDAINFISKLKTKSHQQVVANI
ncbi:hypothetical protein PTUN_a1541 [Pseudoalteromonas tunicata]|nr:hypothetical protein PTUN_a1541 [Pseudoalteromonas tunicata]